MRQKTNVARVSLGVWLAVEGFNPSPILPPDGDHIRRRVPDLAVVAVGD